MHVFASHSNKQNESFMFKFDTFIVSFPKVGRNSGILVKESTML